MNARTTVSSDGQIRRAFSVEDVERMVAVGIIEPDERLEIVAGEILPMSPKGNRHDVLKQHLTLHFVRRLPAPCTLVTEAGWHLGSHLYLEPDYLFFHADRPLAEVKGPDALLVVEIADASLGYDLGRKSVLYGGEGVREFWVIDAATRETHVHLSPSTGGYGSVRVYPPTIELAPEFVRGLTVRMGELPKL